MHFRIWPLDFRERVASTRHDARLGLYFYKQVSPTVHLLSNKEISSHCKNHIKISNVPLGLPIGRTKSVCNFIMCRRYYPLKEYGVEFHERVATTRHHQ